MKTKITVIIPTRERLSVLRFCVETVLAQKAENLAILISDNCSEDGTAEYVLSLEDPRVRYVNTGRRVSMTDNWEFALSQVESGWITFLGDDDGLVPGAISRLQEIISKTDAEAITYNACNYIWPGVSGSDVGRLIVPLLGGSQKRSAASWLNLVMEGRADYSDLPILYVKGAVSMGLINRVKNKGNRFFNSCIPDIYASMALAREVKSYLFVNEPLAIIGSSRFSNGASLLAEGAATVGTGEFRRFLAEATIPFHADIPLQRNGAVPHSLQMIVYEAYLQSAFVNPEQLIPSATPAMQLELALAHPYAPNRFDQANREWGQEFASKHELHFENILKGALRRRVSAKWREVWRKIQLAFCSLVIFDRAVDLDNVYTASIVAGTVRWIKPTLSFRLHRAYIRMHGEI